MLPNGQREILLSILFNASALILKSAVWIHMVMVKCITSLYNASNHIYLNIHDSSH